MAQKKTMTDLIQMFKTDFEVFQEIINMLPPNFS